MTDRPRFSRLKIFASSLNIALCLGAVALVALYLLPSLVGKNKRNFNAILILNIFLGWTFIGWVVALVWAATRDPDDPRK